MKWFKHLAGSLNNSDIFEAIEKFGSDGYLVFFGTLELMADEFDINQPGICRISAKKLTKNLQLSRQKTVKILKFFHEKERIFFEDHGETIILNCPRLAELTDEYTEKQRKKMSGQTPDSSRDKLRPKEEEAEEEVDKDIKNKEKNKAVKPPPIPKIKFLDSVFLTESEYQKLQEAIGQKSLDIGIEKLDYSITVKGGKYKDHYKTLLNWKKRGYLDGNTNTSANEHKPYYQSKFRVPGQRQPADIPQDVLADIAAINRLQAQKKTPGAGGENTG